MRNDIRVNPMVRCPYFRLSYCDSGCESEGDPRSCGDVEHMDNEVLERKLPNGGTYFVFRDS